MLPVILVNGLIACMNDPEVIKAIDSPNAFVPDLLGYGAYKDTPVEQLTLDNQVTHLHEWIIKRVQGPVHLVGHSVGGVTAVLFADRYPNLVESIVSVEGNFVLADAFWSQEVAKMTPKGAEEMLVNFKSDKTAWLNRTGINPDGRTLSIAQDILEGQPASTIRATAQSVIEVTGHSSFLNKVKKFLDSKKLFHLLAGERALEGWNIPPWVRSAAASLTVIPGTGHLMMIEDPKGFGESLRQLLS